MALPTRAPTAPLPVSGLTYDFIRSNIDLAHPRFALQIEVENTLGFEHVGRSWECLDANGNQYQSLRKGYTTSTYTTVLDLILHCLQDCAQATYNAPYYDASVPMRGVGIKAEHAAVLCDCFYDAGHDLTNHPYFLSIGSGYGISVKGAGNTGTGTVTSVDTR